MIKWLPPVGGVFVAVTLGLTACVQGPEGQACNAGQCPSGRVCHAGLCLVNQDLPANADSGPLSPIDKDRDGYSPPEDCNDDDPSVHPGAEDAVGDNRDTNCDDVDGVRGSSGFDGGPSTTDGGAMLCEEGDTRCDEQCVDLQTDPLNCGGCDLVCDAQERCENGECVVRSETGCDEGLDDCGDQGDPLCVDIQQNGRHCGQCGNVCGENSDCVDGQCEASGPVCAQGLTNCGDDAAPICADQNFHRQHCGECNTGCNPDQNCVDGSCVNNAYFPEWCPNGMAHVFPRAEGGTGSLYWFCDASDTPYAVNQSTWSDQCQRAGGYLLTVTSEAERGFVADNRNTFHGAGGGGANYWTAATMSADLGHWVWENGEDPRQWDPWSAGQGNDAGPNGDSPCGYYAAGALGDTWAVGACDANYSGICEFRID